MRLFIAINLPPELRQRLWETAEPLRAARYPVRWVGPEALHLTLKFLGEVEPAREPEITAVMESAVGGAKRFTMPIGGFGAFPSPERPRVVWAGCEAVPPLELLQHRLEQEMERLGFPLEGRAFRPHLTLGRAKREANARDFGDIEERMGSLEFAGEAPVESLDLMESQLGRDGARYTRRHAVPLAG